jgi:predicted Zn-dependent protease with MMP-like domain
MVTLGVRIKGEYALNMIDVKTTAPTIADFEAMARLAFEQIPPELSAHVDGVVVRVEEFPDEETERELQLETPFDLLGLYSGVSLNDKSVLDAPQDIDMIYLYRRPILDYWCESGEDLQHLIRHVLIHEIGHHFGFSDEDMEAIEAWVDHGLKEDVG